MVRLSKRACLVIAVLAAAETAGAQIMRRPSAPRRVNWGGVNVGIVQGYGIADGTTGATWQFGSALEYAARFEHPTQGGISIGAQAAFARAPLTYSSSACPSCDATARVTQAVGLLHYGAGYSFHPVYELSAGVIGYSDFRRRDDASVQLGVNTTDYDFKFSLGYGLGFGLSPSSAIEVIQEFGSVLHQRDGLAGSSSNYPRVYVTRLGGKISF